MSNIQTFIDQLKSDNVLEAFQTVKDELSARARTITENYHQKVAESFNMKPLVENKDDDENLSDEEKEAAKAKEAEEAAKDK